MASSVTVRGLPELRRTLIGLRDEIRREIALDGLRAGAGPMRDGVQEQVASRTRGRGRAARRIVIDDDFKRLRSRRRRTARATTLARLGDVNDPAVAIGPSKKAFYLQFVEFGWQPKGGKRVPGKDLLQRAFDRKRRETARTAQRVIKRGVEAYARSRTV